MHQLYKSREAYHEARAQHWLAAGKPDYADGSRRKAANWRARIMEMDVALHGPRPMTPMQSLRDEVMTAAVHRAVDHLADALLHGSGSRMTGLFSSIGGHHG